MTLIEGSPILQVQRLRFLHQDSSSLTTTWMLALNIRVCEGTSLCSLVGVESLMVTL